jgi:SNF2 family DNA or RNA helicase
VRQAGDLADATVICESGLTQLMTELSSEAAEIGTPAKLRATLRGYQQRGLGWLFHRTRLGLGALLADDMGLGKTVQLIALLLQLREYDEANSEDGGGATLLVCPASLVGNWERELARFGPSLKVIRHHGSARHKDATNLQSRSGGHDIVLTTYGLVRRDADLLAKVSWGMVVCDEAQNIKNPGSAQAKAVRGLTSRRKVALSGTPVENRLTELWGLMEFLNPGLLGTMDRFRREIALPLERERDARALRWLKAATSPFILRRMKSDPAIAPELPEKEIIRVFCSLTEEQAKLYKKAVEDSLGALDSLTGIERSGRVLKLLTEVKQICNHPSHYLDDHESLSGRSGKLERAAEMLEEIVESGERTLIFTQYVEMGTRLCRYLERRLNVPVPFFHGGLSLEERDEMVRQFQEHENGPPILVLSLRAGGVGLNLTRASHVLHYDRWWNPAIEDQATDRAYRIGQTKRVQVHHLITIGTLEEKIDRMLEEKRGLADAVVAGGEQWLTQLSTDELRALVSLGSDAAVESMESWEG